MSLDSSDSFPAAAEGKSLSDRQSSPSGKKEHPESNWVFLFTHRLKLDQVNDKLKEKFETFVHRTIVYQHRGKGKTIKKELPTVSGLIFIRGAASEVQKYLDSIFNGLYLVKDYSRGRTAEISPEEMETFMKLSTIGKAEVRFMLNPLDYYSKGHQRIRITSGDLEGCEGYIVRLHRDRKLITQIGNMTVAIGGISKESFENAEEFVEMRTSKGASDGVEKDTDRPHREIDKYFFTPANDLEAMAIARNLEPLIARFQREMRFKDADAAADGVIHTLREIAGRFSPKYFKNEAVGINDVCMDLIRILRDATDNSAIAEETKEKISVELESLMLRHPVLPIDEIVNIST